ncbi:hypothetical protein BOX15_Mlig012638g8, partial [Macrostomum lignano]
LTMSEEVQKSCESRLCGNQSCGTSPYSGLLLCQTYLDKDIKLVGNIKTELMQKLQFVMTSEHRSLLRAEQSSLEAELQEVSDAFDALQEQVQQWRERTMSRVQAAHDSVASRLRDAAEAEDCSKEVSEASDAGDWKKVMQLTYSFRMWAEEAQERSESFDQRRSELFLRQSSDYPNASSNLINKFGMRSVGDVTSGVQNLQFVIDRHMSEVVKHCWLDIENSGTTDRHKPPQICRSVASVENLPGRPSCLAVCTNTAGFVGDSSGCVAKSESADSGSEPLPQPCVFVGFYAQVQDEQSESEVEVEPVDYILAISLDGDLRLKCRFNLTGFEWQSDIWDLHCDSERQLLYVSQPSCVAVVNLSGAVYEAIIADSFNDLDIQFGFIDGNQDKLCTFHDRNLFSLSKNDLSSDGIVSTSCSFEPKSPDANGFLVLAGKNIHISRDSNISILCRISCQLLSVYSTIRTVPDQFNLNGLAVDSRSVRFFSSTVYHTVTVLDCFANVLQTLGSVSKPGTDEESFNSPGALCIAELADSRRLIVSDENNRRLRVYEVL